MKEEKEEKEMPPITPHSEAVEGAKEETKEEEEEQVLRLTRTKYHKSIARKITTMSVTCVVTIKQKSYVTPEFR